MDEKRKYEISHKILKHIAGVEGIKLNSSTKKRLEKLSKAINVPLEELKEHHKETISELEKEYLD